MVLDRSSPRHRPQDTHPSTKRAIGYYVMLARRHETDIFPRLISRHKNRDRNIGNAALHHSMSSEKMNHLGEATFFRTTSIALLWYDMSRVGELFAASR